jgi:hypothetical protein
MGGIFSRLSRASPEPPPVAPFVANIWVDMLRSAILNTINNSEIPLKYSEIGTILGLNETCISGKKFKDSLMMNMVEDLVNNDQVRWSRTPGRPYVERIE